MSATGVYRNALPLGSMLQEYRLDAMLGAGGFGLTYLATDTHLEKRVAIKEYLPADLAMRALDGSLVPVNTESDYDYKWGLERFLQEARTLGRFSHPHIVRVNRYFEAHGTAYMVMDYEEGESLSQLLKREPAVDENRLRSIVLPLAEGLRAVHEAGFLHRDIKPSNIFIRRNGAPVLLDFGAARSAAGGSRGLTAVLTPGYAPLEQYSSERKQGPWSDIYALCGVMFRVMTGQNPPDAIGRMQNDTVPQQLQAVAARYSEPMRRAVAAGLAVQENLRPQNLAQWLAVLGDAAPAGAVNHAPAARPMPAAPPVAAPTASRLRPRTQPPSPPPREPVRRWVHVVAITALCGFAYAGWKAQQPAPAKEIAAPALPNAVAQKGPMFEIVPVPAQADAPPPAPVRDAAADTEPAVASAQTATVASVQQREQQPSGSTGAPERFLQELARGAEPSRGPDYELVKQRAEHEFRLSDTDRNGFLTRDELGRFPFILQELQRVDRDGDGRISAAEFVALRALQSEWKKNRAH